MKFKSITVAAAVAVLSLSACTPRQVADAIAHAAHTESQDSAPAPTQVVTTVGGVTFTATCDSLTVTQDGSYPLGTQMFVEADSAPTYHMGEADATPQDHGYTWNHFVQSYGVYIYDANTSTLIADTNTQNTLTPC